jgi:hypothetical protein
MLFRFFKKPEIVDVEEKRKAVIRFCEAMNEKCDKCVLWFKVPWYEECYYWDEEVDRSYNAIYGSEDAKLINDKWDVLDDIINKGILSEGSRGIFHLLHKFIVNIEEKKHEDAYASVD